VVSGPSGSGKSSLIAEVLTRVDIDYSVSATTRLPRPGEINGTHYNFISLRDFQAKIDSDDLLEWAEYNHHFYGTPAAPIDAANEAGRSVLLEIELQGAKQVRNRRADAIMIFISPPSMKVLENRLRSRGDTDDEDIAERLKIAEAEMEAAPEVFDHIVVNDEWDLAVDELTSLITDRL
jgi:guanylate kinase